MKRFFTTLLSFILVIATMFSLSACSTSDKNTTSNNTSKKATKFVPLKNMTKLVLVTNTHSFGGEYQKVLNQFNLKLSELGKKYYLDIKLIDNSPSYKKGEEEATSYNKKYHNGVLDMKSKNEQVDIIRFDTGDDSDYYNDYDYFYLNNFLTPLDDYINKDTSIKNIIDDKSFTAAKRNGKIYAVPDILNGIGRGLNVKTSQLKSSGLTEKDLESERWEILNNSKLSSKKIFIDPQANTMSAGLELSDPPYCAELYYDLITPCVGVKFDSDSAKAINIYQDEYITKSIKSTYSMGSFDKCKLSIVPAYTSSDKVTTNSIDGTITIPINDKLYSCGNISGLGIANWSKNANYAYDLISLLNTNKELATLLNYGIEGVNYTKNDDGTVKLSNSEGDNYYNPNCIFSNSKILPTNEDYPYTDNSKDTVLSPIYSFIFDYTKVKSEIIATNKVITKYKSNLFVGKGDYAELSKKFNEDLEKAGVQKIVDEANKQIAIWQKTNK